ncbi:hypothetical protein LX87_03251 [Larkinella arboricola]|uniref:DUF8201 domain-containing protein n=1 Tax=Larkinella arboricola TaxID=643671 RepID=A0A327WT49_LARAB|nr:hypothetical protein [Larkinella arboricola]RAJ95504.1 hypothetical protein LX87_03251 [Larkinella arboricola]
MILVLLWGAILVSCLAYGLFLYKVLTACQLIDETGPVRGSELILAGLSLLVGVLQIASFFVPTNFYLSAIWLGGALVIAGLYRSGMTAYVRQFWEKQKQIPVFWLLFLAIVLYSTLSPDHFDSGIYHLPSIRWNERFPVIPGLGNLHGRLAFNSSFFVVSAAWGLTDLVGQTLYPLNGAIFLLVCWRLMSWKQTQYPVLSLLLLLLVLYYLTRHVFSPTPDLPATLLPMTMMLMWLDQKPGFGFQLVVMVLLIALCVTIKLATIPIVLALIPIGWAVRPYLTVSRVALVLSIGLAFAVPWVLRNIILSGYLIYPFPGLDLFSFDWKIPIERTHHERDYVEFWAKFRIHEAYMNVNYLKMSFAKWVPMWWERQGNFFNRPIWVVAVLSPLVMLSHLLAPKRRVAFNVLLMPYLVTLAGFLFWFLSAPDFRFGYAFIWLTALIPWLPILPEPAGERMLSLWCNRLAGSASVILIGFFVVYYLVIKHFPIQQYALIPKPLSYRDKGAYESLFTLRHTRSGLEVLNPVGSPLEQNCYEEEGKLCAPFFYPDLELRGTRIEEGFRSSLQVQKQMSLNK